jgi:hypothetical protein
MRGATLREIGVSLSLPPTVVRKLLYSAKHKVAKQTHDDSATRQPKRLR